MQLVGLKAVYFGEPLADGITSTTDYSKFTKFTQPYQGGITLNFSLPSSTKWHREGEKLPAQTLRDATSGEQKLTWNTMDYDENTKNFYFGDTVADKNDVFEREKAAVFVSESGASIVFARLKIVSTPGGGLNATGDPLLISSEADVLAPSNANATGLGWDVIATPETLPKDATE